MKSTDFCRPLILFYHFNLYVIENIHTLCKTPGAELHLHVQLLYSEMHHPGRESPSELKYNNKT